MTKNKVSSELKSLDRLVGTWKITGDATGTTEYKWSEGGLFLIKDVDMEYAGKQIKGIEFIGHLHKVGKKPTEEIWSRFYHFTEGLTLDYVYQMHDNTLTIWFEEKDANNFYTGTFDKQGKSIKGAWQWPGGGYSIVAEKVEK